MHIWNAIIKGILEGFTEFLPISSTGHLILVRDLLPLTASADAAEIERVNTLFDIVIQFPAVLAIVILYRRRLWDSVRTLTASTDSRRFWGGICLAFVPAAIVGVLFHRSIEHHLMNPTCVALALIVGGLILLVVERIGGAGAIGRAEDVPLGAAVIIGCFQCLGMIPGVSRSGATIVGGRLWGLDRSAAAEFSFFLALPTMGGAFAYKLAKSAQTLRWSSDGPLLAAGSAASFITAAIVVYGFIRFLQKYGLSVFGWYRIVLGFIVLSLR